MPIKTLRAFGVKTHLKSIVNDFIKGDNNMGTKLLPGSEQNRLKRAWIWFWYNDTSRFLFVMFGGFTAIVATLLYLAGAAEYTDFRYVISIIYIGFSAWAMVDNDYENLNRIGLTVYRKPIKNERPAFLDEYK